MSLAVLPHLNAILNATSGCLLVAGYMCVRQRRLLAHKGCMLSALAVTTLFFVSYLTYHVHVGSVRFRGVGWIRTAYFTILISHTLLAIAIVPLAWRPVFLGVRNRLSAHMALAHWTLPIWLYVSVTGVIVYWMLYHLQ